MTSHYDFWLVDLDGTLVDVDPSYIHHVVTEVGHRVGYPFTTEQAEMLWHGLSAPPEIHLERWGIDPIDFWTAFHEVENAEARAAATFLYPDAAALASIREPIGLVTHCQSYLTEPVLERLDMTDWFDVVVCCDDGIGWKPDPRPVQYAIDSLEVGLDTHAGVMVGDSPLDVGAAWNAGIDAVHLERHGHDRRGSCVRADTSVATFEELFVTA